MPDLVKRIDEYLETAPDSHPDDFSITSDKNDSDPHEVSLYIMRDVLSWWVHWGGALRPGDYWKQIYSHSWDDCKQGLLGEGMPPEDVESVEMCLWRQVLTQYFEKVDPKVYRLLKSKTTLMTQYRVHTGNTLGCAALILAADGVSSGRVEDNALEAASIAQCLSMDMAKEALGILQGKKTETVAGERVQLKRELRWVYVRCMEYLETQPNAQLLRRFASAGLHYVPMMDRYLERARGNIRFPIQGAKSRILEPFINRAYVPEGLNPDGRPFTKMDGIALNGLGGVTAVNKIGRVD